MPPPPVEVRTPTVVDHGATPEIPRLQTPYAPELPGSSPPGTLTHPSNGTQVAGALVGRGTPQVSTRRLNLKDVVLDPAIAAKDPSSLLNHPEARAIADLLDQSGTVLLIGHVSPDGDCVGSTLSLARALRALGKSVDVVVDDTLSLSLQQLDADHAVKRASEVKGKAWDLALVMDVGEPGRIGGAAALLTDAKALGVVDHHLSNPTRASFQVPEGKPFHAWVEPDFPATALQSAALLSRSDDALAAKGVDLKDVYMPALAGFATDTGFGNYQGSSTEYFPYFKHMMKESAASSMEELDAALAYRLPQRLIDVVHGVKIDETKLPASLARELRSLRESHRAIETEILHGKGGRRLGVLTVHSAYFGALLKLARLDDPRLGALDVANLIKWDAVSEMRRQHHCDVTCLLSEQRDGTIKVSARSRGTNEAVSLAGAFGGGGHGPAAGASTTEPLPAVRARVLAWARQNGLA